MKFDPFQKEIEFILDYMRQAMPLARRIQQGIQGESITKKDKSPVTVGDFSLQAVFGKYLGDRFPNDSWVGEESAESLRKETGGKNLSRITNFVGRLIPGISHEKVCAFIDQGKSEGAGRFWTLDPIDGTSGFLRGDQYAVALALIEDGVVQIGGIGCPHLNPDLKPDFKGEGSVALGIKNQGVWITPLFKENFIPLRVSTVSNPREATPLDSVEPSHTNKDFLKAIWKDLLIAKPAILMDSLAKYVSLAGGRGELLMYPLPMGRPDYRMKIWDVAPGAVIVHEAGGQTSDIHGRPLDFSCGLRMAKNPGIVVTNGLFHEKVITSLGRLS